MKSITAKARRTRREGRKNLIFGFRNTARGGIVDLETIAESIVNAAIKIDARYRIDMLDPRGEGA